MNFGNIKNFIRHKIAKRVFILFIAIISLIYLLHITSRMILTKSAAVTTMAETSSPSYVLSIYTLEDYLAFAESVNKGNTYAGQYVNLYTDLDFSDVTENIIVGTEDGIRKFKGIFDGNAHHIRNLTIDSETDAGMFRNLSGTICNLVLESGSITGSICGGIASTTNEDAHILNCGSYAQIYGDTENGIVGDANGTVLNCIGPYDETTIDSLTQGLCGLGGSYKVDDWYLWEMVDGRPSLSLETADTLLSMSTTFRIDTEEVTLYAYYSLRDEAWCFALPAGCEETELDVKLQFAYGEEIILYRTAGLSELSYEVDGISYYMEFIPANCVPSLMINTLSSGALEYLHENKENRLQGIYILFNEDGSIGSEGKLDKIKGHGNDSWQAIKKSYNLTLHESEDLLGMGASENYALLAAYRLNSLLAYKLTFDLCNEIEMDYPPNANFVHLYVDGEYLGMYLLSGKIEIGENRFPLKDMELETQTINHLYLENYELKEWHSDDTSAMRIWHDLPNVPDDITGGTILELNNEGDYDELQSRFVSDRDYCIVLRNMPYAAREQVDYIADFWQDFEDALYADDGYNGKGKYYAEYIDLESFADQWLLYELNEEASLYASVFFYKDSDLIGDGLLHASWLWDAERSLTYNDEKASHSFLTYYYPDSWWVQLYRHKDFAEKVYQEWTQKFIPALEKVLSPDYISDSDGIGSLGWYLDAYGDDGRLNNTRWLNCNYEDKMARVQYVYTARKDFLTKALALYESGYSYYYELDGVFYGVTESGEEVIMESVETNE